MNNHYYLCIMLFLVITGCNSANQDKVSENPVKDTSVYDVAAYYWPAYHDEDRWRPFFQGREGEWEIIRNSKPKYPGHNQPRKPLWGYEDETKPGVMEKKIDAAISHGVNVMIFDWYWYTGEPFLEKCIDEGFLKAKNNNQIKFYIMWANHAATTLWDKRRSHKMDTIWPGTVNRANFDKVADRIISKYMKHPSYYKINGEPVLSIYEVGTLISGLGGIQPTKDALESFRKKVKAAGFPGLHIQGILWEAFPASVSGVPADTMTTQNNTVKTLGINSLTNYQFVHLAAPEDDYVQWGNKAIALWPKWDTSLSVPYFPHVATDWDTNSRFVKFSQNIKHNVTAENFKAFLLKAKAYVDAHPKQPKLITINSWNEWSEGSYLEPDTVNGMKYLEAVREVFKQTPDTRHSN